MIMHYKMLCSCGAVIQECRCPDPNKMVTTIKEGCFNCHEADIARKSVERRWCVFYDDDTHNYYIREHDVVPDSRVGWLLHPPRRYSGFARAYPSKTEAYNYVIEGLQEEISEREERINGLIQERDG